jgi:hypothetical protein
MPKVRRRATSRPIWSRGTAGDSFAVCSSSADMMLACKKGRKSKGLGLQCLTGLHLFRRIIIAMSELSQPPSVVESHLKNARLTGTPHIQTHAHHGQTR